MHFIHYSYNIILILKTIEGDYIAFIGFNQDDFNTFLIDGLDERMQAIQERIQPKFKDIFQLVEEDVNRAANHDMHLHVAKHARRTVNPPNDTWSAYCHNKRGYKKHPHFQIGVWEDNLFVWLAYIYELPSKKEIATKFLQDIDDIQQVIPNHFHISLNHMKNDASLFSEMDLQTALERFYHVKKGELLIGKRFASDDPIVQNGEALIGEIKQIIHTLAPIYRSSMDI